MTDKKNFPGDCNFYRMITDFNAQFLFEVISHPLVMISGEEKNRKAPIPQFGKFPENPYITTRNYLLVLKPEIKKITENKQCLCIMGNFIQPSNKSFFSFERG